MLQPPQREQTPNSRGGEYCPDWPRRCRCPIQPPHHHLPVQASACGHCQDEEVLTPVVPNAPATNPILTGTPHCTRCQQPLCPECSQQDDTAMRAECEAANPRPRTQNHQPSPFP